RATQPGLRGRVSKAVLAVVPVEVGAEHRLPLVSGDPPIDQRIFS
ncbi:MAG: hypothetical protein QG606_159, partial [Patescibacteria group bacterium]|nr:hypothetical protein [Patescibacteria group bacterium]